jgi:hypothetical protein
METTELTALLRTLDHANESEENLKFLNEKRRSSSVISHISHISFKDDDVVIDQVRQK